MTNSPTTTVRLVIDAPASGAWNMAVDETLLESATETGVATLRFYRWDCPTLSLGYFQPFADRAHHPASSECPIVRRSSGGGAIVHDHELTYSLALPRRHTLGRRTSASYDAMHESLLDALSTFGVKANLCSEALHTKSSSPDLPEPLLCFERRAVGDVLVGETKIAGSAQRRRRQAILQHGSVLLKTSAAAPQLAGLNEAAGVELSSDSLLAAWQLCLVASLATDFHPADLTPSEQTRAAQIVRAKHTCAEWLHRR